MIPNNRQTQFKPVYYLQRAEGPKNNLGNIQSAKNLSLNVSIGANQTPYNIDPYQKPKQDSNPQSNTEIKSTNPSEKFEKIQYQMKMVTKQNSMLREQNQQLRKQLIKMRRQHNAENVRSSQKCPSISPDNLIDLRGTIKKESSQIKDLKIKLDMVSKQCKMYEEIIDKMDQRIKKLTHDNHKKNTQIDQIQLQLGKLDQLKEKANSIMRLYNDLQSKFNNDQLQWMKWKQNWLSQKEFFLNRVKELQNMVEKKFS